MKRRRRSRYSLAICKAASALAQQGKTDKQIYLALRIADSTFYRWLRVRKDFANAIALARLPEAAYQALKQQQEALQHGQHK